jgi:hypothetical protein
MGRKPSTTHTRLDKGRLGHGQRRRPAVTGAYALSTVSVVTA